MLELINFTTLSRERILMILRWRNDERVAKFMKNKSVSLEEHLNFISNLKNDETKRYFLVRRTDETISAGRQNLAQNGERNTRPTDKKESSNDHQAIKPQTANETQNKDAQESRYIGVIDFVDITTDSCEFGIYANPELKGVGRELMGAVVAYGFMILSVERMDACVFNENEKAASLYLNFGFETIKNDGKLSFLQLKKEKIMEILIKNYKFLTDEQNRQLLKIRNLEGIRKMSLNDKEIGFEEHKKWLQTANGGGSAYLAVFADGEICGGINLVCKEGEHSWGLFFEPQTSGFLISSCTFCFLNFAFSRTDTLNALVKNDNETALKFDKNFGFTEFKRDENFTFLMQDEAHWQEHKKTKLMQKVAKISREFDIRISA